MLFFDFANIAAGRALTARWMGLTQQEKDSTRKHVLVEGKKTKALRGHYVSGAPPLV